VRVAEATTGMHITRDTYKSLCMDITDERTETGTMIKRIFNLLLILNVVNTLQSTVPELDEDGTRTRNLFRIVEYGCSFAFLVEYIINVFSRGTLAWATSGWRVIDFFCLLPALGTLLDDLALIQLAGERSRAIQGVSWFESSIELFTLFRVCRILDFQGFKIGSNKVIRGLRDATTYLIVPFCLAFSIWIILASAFWLAENSYFGPSNQHFDTIPTALYWTSMFVIGEWPIVDFSPEAGSKLVVFTILIAQTMFMVPFGIIVESIQSSIAKAMQEEKDTLQILMEQANQAKEGGEKRGSQVRRGVRKSLKARGSRKLGDSP